MNSNNLCLDPTNSRMFIKLTALSLVLVLAAATGPLDAEQMTVFEFEVESHRLVASGKTSSVDSRSTYFLPGQLRQDRGRVSYILSATPPAFYLIDHRLSETFVFEPTVDLNDLLGEQAREGFRIATEQAGIRLEEKRFLGELQFRVGGSCRQYLLRLTSRHGRLQQTSRVCLAKEVPIDLELYWRVALNHSKVTSRNELFWEALAELGGFPIHWEESGRVLGESWSWTSKLVSIRQEEADPALFEPPEAYSRSLPDPHGRFISRPIPVP